MTKIGCLQESPRWLLSRKRYDEVAQFFKKVARVNRKELDPEFVANLPQILRKIGEDSRPATGDKATAKTSDRRYSTLDLFRTPNLAKKSVILILINVCNMGVYLGLTYYGPSVNASPHWSFFMTVLAEMPSYIVTSLMIDRFGRRLTLVGTMVLTGVVGLSAAAVPNASVSILMGLVFFSKFTISIAWVVSELQEDGKRPMITRATRKSLAFWTVDETKNSAHGKLKRKDWTGKKREKVGQVCPSTQTRPI